MPTPFLDTEPAAIDPVDIIGPWEQFRVIDPRKCLAVLAQVKLEQSPVTIGHAEGLSLAASLWSVDGPNRRVYFNVDAAAPAEALLADARQAWAAMYLGDVKLQFWLRGLTLSRAPARGHAAAATRSLYAELPSQMYCLPRRRDVRVRHGPDVAPLLRFEHPLTPGSSLVLGLLDVSATGCAMRKPADTLPLLPGTEIRQVEVELDEHTLLFADLQVVHVSVMPGDRLGGQRVGCTWQHMPDGARERLLGWIQNGRRRRDLMTLTLTLD